MSARFPQTFPLNVALNIAIVHQKAGRLRDAERIYGAILKEYPNCADANHNLGVLAMQVGRRAAALPCLKAALDANPANRQYALSYAEALLGSGQAGEALTILQGALERGINDPVVQALQQRAKAAALDASAMGEAPSLAEMHQLAGLFDAGRDAELELRARSLVERYPASGLAWKALGASLQRQGKDALVALRKAAELLQGDAEAHNNLGIALKSLGQLDAAVASYRWALEIKPDFAEAHFNLGLALKGNGQLDAAIASYGRALEIKPDFAEAYSNLGIALQTLGQLDEAVASYRQALQVNPEYAEAHFNLGVALQALGRFGEAAASCRRALQFNPRYADAHYSLGNALHSLGQLEGAAESYRRALEIKPEHAEAYYNLGNALWSMGQVAGAAVSYRRALEIEPAFCEAHCNLGNALGALGKLDDAVASYRRALEIKTGFAQAHLNLSMVRKAKVGDEDMAALIAAMEVAQRSGTALQDKERWFLHFALGKSYDDIGDYEEAFPHFLEGCRLKRRTFRYDPDQTTLFFDSIMRNLDAAAVDRLRGGGDPSYLPIFILGMPRSGTTLIEQVVASHPKVHGAGELPELFAIAQREIAGVGFPDNVRGLDQAHVTAWGAEYLSKVRHRAPDALHITDKLPHNFLVVGLIRLMLPNAKIIHLNRDPVDNCLSCFFTPFEQAHEYAYDLAELGRYYVDYVRLMDYWRKLLPEGAFLDVRYEEFLADREPQSRRIIEYCGLEWNNACLDFYRNPRPIRTASVTQVRQPTYISSMQRWRYYEKFLQPLLDALGNVASIDAVH